LTQNETRSGDYFWSDHQADDELTRLKLIEQLNDPSTFRQLDAIGVAEGWRCLEVGAGAGSVVRWLSQRVGPAGKVVAIDLDVRFLGDDTPHTLRSVVVTSLKIPLSRRRMTLYAPDRS
jgi:2-polyprenyl-3-methyl-5-hydroxy-6-metoxy-1,4-benzoquinol methylase